MRRLWMGLLLWSAHREAQAVPCASESTGRVTIRGTSMVGLYAPGRVVLAEYGYYACHEVGRGEVALIRRPARSEPIIKSILVLPGDRFRLQGDASGATLWVNEQELRVLGREVYRFSGRAFRMLQLYVKSFHGVMPPDTYFVFGTSPTGSLDSTQFGPVTREMLVARIVPKGQLPPN